MHSAPAKNACRAVGYLRVSTDEQVAEGVSLAAQEAAIRAYASLRGFDLVDVVIDAGVSGSKALAKRAGGQRLLDVLRRERVAVISFKLDRIFRNARDCLAVTADWDRRGVALHLVDMGGQTVDTSTAMGKFFMHLLAGVAEMERNLISERTRTALRHKKAKGERIGDSAPVGFTFDGDAIVPHKDEQRAVALALELRDGGCPVREIAARLNASGIKSRGTRWHPTTVARILARTVPQP